VNSRKLIELDWPRLFQVLVILLDNSIKFSDGGVVRVTVSKLPSGRLQILVADNGPGMDEETLRDLFELFPYQATENVKLKSRGLGMILVKKLCDLMEISLETQSLPKSGTTFKLTLPDLTAVAIASDAGPTHG
jgi:signal transduction histidine kinase